MRIFTDALTLGHAPIRLERFRHKIAAVLATTVLLFQCATVLTAALGLIVLAVAAADGDADRANQALLGLLATIN